MEDERVICERRSVVVKSNPLSVKQRFTTRAVKQRAVKQFGTDLASSKRHLRISGMISALVRSGWSSSARQRQTKRKMRNLL